MKRFRLTGLVSVVLSCVLLVSQIPIMSAASANDTGSVKYPYAVFAGDEGNSLDFAQSNITMNGNIHTNGTLTAKGSYNNINGECSAVGGVTKGQGTFNVTKITANPQKEDTIIISKKIKDTYFTSNCDSYDTAYTKSDVNVNLNKSLYDTDSINLTGNISLNGSIGANSNITLNGGTLNSNNIVLYSKSGDININSTNATVNGLIYAPNGKVTVSGQGFQVNGIIIAKQISINSSNVNINYSDSVAKFVGTTSEKQDGWNEKTYTGELSYSQIDYDKIVKDEESGEQYVSNELLLTTADNVSKSAVEQIISPYNASIVGRIELTNDYQIRFNQDKSKAQLDQIISELKQNAAIESVYLNEVSQLAPQMVKTNDAKWANEEWSEDFPEGSNWGIEAIKAPSAWESLKEMIPIKIGLIDGAFDAKHEDLKFAETPYNNIFISQTSTVNKLRDHGTHVAGIMAATYNNGIGISGVTPKAQLYGFSINGSSDPNLKNLPKSYTESNTDTMKFKYALATLITKNVKIINLSMDLESPNYAESDRQAECYGPFLQKFLKYGYDFVIVQSAGNEHIDAMQAGYFTAITEPDVKNRVIVVGAIGCKGSRRDGLFGWFGKRIFNGYYFAPFSNYGDRVDVVAPGVDITSTIPGSLDSSLYESMEGTSMASPFVAGTAAMTWSANPDLSGAQVKEIIVKTADKTVVNNEKKGSKDYHLINAEAAVEKSKNTVGTSLSFASYNTGTVSGIVTDLSSGKALDHVRINAYRITTGDGNITDNHFYEESDESDDEGNYNLILKEGTYSIDYYLDGYLPAGRRTITVNSGEVKYVVQQLEPDLPSGSTSIASGTVSNAVTGKPIESATVKFREGWDNTYGDYVAYGKSDLTTYTDTSGGFLALLKAGEYTAEITKGGYVTGYINVSSSPYGSSEVALLTPVLNDDEYRVVLTWSDQPADLDSHITGPLSNGKRFHAYFSNKQAYDNGKLVANLDIDDTSSYGPETTTVTLIPSADGVYRYSVHDYTDRSSSTSKSLSLSGAQVELYNGNHLITTYHVPINKAGTLWNVFEIDKGKVTAINAMSFVSNPSAVQ